MRPASASGGRLAAAQAPTREVASARPCSGQHIFDVRYAADLMYIFYDRFMMYILLMVSFTRLLTGPVDPIQHGLDVSIHHDTSDLMYVCIVRALARVCLRFRLARSLARSRYPAGGLPGATQASSEERAPRTRSSRVPFGLWINGWRLAQRAGTVLL